MTEMTNANASCHYRVQLQILSQPISSTTDEREIFTQAAGQFLQEEKGEELAEHIVSFIEGTR